MAKQSEVEAYHDMIVDEHKKAEASKARFEAWARGKHVSVAPAKGRGPNDYESVFTQLAWEAWEESRLDSEIC